MQNDDQETALTNDWKTNPRWRGITRTYSASHVVRLRGSIPIQYTLAQIGAARLWHLMSTEPFVRALGAMTGNQAIESVAAGLKAIYVSGWQVAGDANEAGQIYPDQGLYPVHSVPTLVRRLNNALLRADQIDHMDGEHKVDWLVPIIADAEAGFGGPLNTFELVKSMIEAGAAAIHLEDQLSSLKKCGHMGGKVLVPVHEFIPKLMAARLAADILGVPILIIARTDADGANIIRTAEDPIDRLFDTGKRTVEGFSIVRGGVEYAIAKGRAYAPYADMLWCETNHPDLDEAREFARGIHRDFPGKWLAYNCSPSFNWKRHMDEKALAGFQEKLAEMGYQFQFVTLAGWHANNAGMFELARAYRDTGMLAYSRLQEREFKMEQEWGYRAVKHQRFVGAGYFDEIQMAITGEAVSTKALKGSTEEAQFAETPDLSTDAKSAVSGRP
jgi:isocitrate lyase